MYVKSIEFMIKAHSLLTASWRPSTVKLIFGGGGRGGMVSSRLRDVVYKMDGWLIDVRGTRREQHMTERRGKDSAVCLLFYTRFQHTLFPCLLVFKKYKGVAAPGRAHNSHSPWSSLWRWREPAGVLYTGTLLPLSALWLRSNHKITSYHGA